MTERSFSVVICTDGRLPFLKVTLRGLAAQDYQNFEICLVCGPSRDGALAFAESLAGKLKLAHCPVRNLSRARNIGIGLAAGEIVAFLDDDAVPEPEWLGDLNAAYENTEIVAAGGVVHDASGVGFQARFVTINRLGYDNQNWTGPASRLNFPFSPEFPHLLGANCSFRRETLIDLGGFDEEYEFFLDETDLAARVNDAGGLIAQSRRAAVHHKFAPSAMRDTARVVRHWGPLIKNRVYYGWRNGARHHTPWEILRAAINDAEQWDREVERSITAGALAPDDLERFRREAVDAVVAGIAAGREPQRRLMSRAARDAEPPPFRPFETLRPSGRRLCLALVTQDYPPGQNGGIARNIAELAQAWTRLGHYVHVFTAAKGEPSVDFEDGVWVHRARIVGEGPPPPLIPPHIVPQSLWDHSRSMRAEVEKLDATRPVNLVYAPLWDCEPAAFLIAPRFPVACALQTTMDFWLDSQPERRRDAAWMRARGAPLLALERWVLERAPLLHANSRAVVEEISRRYDMDFPADRIVFAPHGLSDWAEGAPPEPSTPAQREAVRFLFVGRLESRKGIDVLMAAAPEALRRFPGARLDIVGDDTIERGEGGTYKAAFLARTDGPTRDRVVFHGRVGEPELRRFYRDCDVLVAPSRYELFGLVYLEGMVFGKPVIGGRAGGGPEVIVENVTGLLVEPGDVESLVAAMTRLAGDPELRLAMGRAGRRRYETQFQTDATAKALLDGLLARVTCEARTPR